MDENSLKEPAPPSLDPIETTKEPSSRIRWIDYARGFTMIYLVITTVFPPGVWKAKETNPVLWWLANHPGVYSGDLTLMDIGVPAFIFLIGLSMAISFRRGVERNGLKTAITHQLKRWGLLLILGIILTWALSFEIWYSKTYSTTPGVNDTAWYPEFAGQTFNYIIGWDTIIAIAFTGYIALPFLLIKDGKIRMIIAYIWMTIYGVLFQITDLRGYAQMSVHGGIFGTIFTLVGVAVIASSVGEYIFKSQDNEKQKIIKMAIFGIANLAIGLIIDAIPGWEATKRQGSFSYGIVSIGAVMIGAVIFASIEYYHKKPLVYLEAFGKNPFLTYFIAELPVFILDETIGDDLGLGPIGNIIMVIILMLYTSIVMLWLYKKQKIVTTEKATLIFIITTIVLAILLLGTGAIEL